MKTEKAQRLDNVAKTFAGLIRSDLCIHEEMIVNILIQTGFLRVSNSGILIRVFETVGESN